MRALLTALLLFAAAASPGLAQDAPLGIGFAQAEEGTWLCRDESPEEALACARELCVEQASGQQCWPTAWCYPANWSGVMTVWLEGFHTNAVLCGMPSEESLQAALAAVCAGDSQATHCDLTLTVDPIGNEREIDATRFPGGGAAPDAPAPDGSAPGETDGLGTDGASPGGSGGAGAPATNDAANSGG